MKSFMFVMVVCVLVGLAMTHDTLLDENLDEVWSSFKEVHNKKYASKKEELLR